MFVFLPDIEESTRMQGSLSDATGWTDVKLVRLAFCSVVPGKSEYGILDKFQSSKLRMMLKNRPIRQIRHFWY